METKSFSKLKEKYKSCTLCKELIKSRIQVVFGSGNQNSDILLVGEAPGFNEAKNGKPFCGMSGQILTELLTSVGLSREDIFITNTLLCRPPDNRNPNKEEINNCRNRLDQLIQIIQPKVIVTIGNFATERIINKTGIKSIRGKVFPTIINNQEINVVPVIHPASYLYSGRNPEMFKQMQADFQTIVSVIDQKKCQKNLNEY
ncbi:MAG: uracil-DNA glycosylase [Nanoarchaeota archaeon]|nr:uracil-DNA glycosylase [Nanoarchaeota archaeon]MBU1622826.1 uracil-DNA glycosylase [Nanoarchaeota archaeon]